jgi:AcrR family transcriptional regulator
MGRPKEHDAATRDRLLAAAAQLSASEGWDALSVRRVAEEAGTTTRAVYSVFGSKEGLEEGLHEAMMGRLQELMGEFQETEDPRADLLEMRKPYRRWATERPERYAAMMRFVGPRAGPRSPAGLALARAAESQLRDVIVRCADSGLIVHDDVRDLVLEWRAVAHGLAEFENHGVLKGGDESWRSVLTALIDGYASRNRSR